MVHRSLIGVRRSRSLFLYGRETDLETLRQWIITEHCRVVALLGLGGIGKTSLAVECARQLAKQFDALVFRSVRDAPPIDHLLDDLIHTLATQQIITPERTSEKMIELTRLLRKRRCLLILDNLESILREGDQAGEFRAGYEDYGTLIQRFGATSHESCLLVTSREKPDALAPLEGSMAAVRTFSVDGLTASACQEILQAKDVAGEPDHYVALTRLYGGNPLALSLVSEPIRDLFDGDIATFLVSGDAFFNGMAAAGAAVSSSQFAGADDPGVVGDCTGACSAGTVAACLIEPVPRGDFLKALEALRRRSLIERSGRGASFTLQPVVMEYVTRRLISGMNQAIVDGELTRLARHTLIQATARDYVRRSQERLIATPLIEQLITSTGGIELTERALTNLLDGWRALPHTAHGYGPGNIINLVRLLRGRLHNLNLSGLAIRQAYLQEVEMQDASLAHAHLAETVLAHAFDYGVCVALSRDGTILAAGTNSGEVRLWRVADRAAIFTIQTRGGGVYSMAISADGSRIASGNLDGTIQLWRSALAHV